MSATHPLPSVSPHTGKRRRAPYSRDVCDFCRDSKKRCQPFSSQSSISASALSTQSSPTCEACYRANIPCKRTSRRQHKRDAHAYDDGSSTALDALGASGAIPLQQPTAFHEPLTGRFPIPVSRFDASCSWLAPLSVSRPAPAVRLGWDGDTDGYHERSGPSSRSSFVDVRLVREMPQYFMSYFRLVNDGLFPFLDESQFHADYGNIVVDRILSPDPHWAVAFHAVMAIGARMHGDIAYAAHCTAVALRAVKGLNGAMQQQPPSRLALTYRALLALTYYSACVQDQDETEAEGVEHLLSSAQRLLAVRDVAQRLPADVLRLATSVPEFADAFSLSPLPLCSVDNQLRYQQRAFPLDRRRFLRLRRRLATAPVDRIHHSSATSRVHAHSNESNTAHATLSHVEAADGGGMGEVGESADSIDALDADPMMDVHLDGERVLGDLHRLNVQLAGDTFMRSPRPVEWSIYQALIVLMRAEKSDSVRDLQRVIVYGRLAQCYLLLGQLPSAVLAARQTLRGVESYDGPLTKYPPYSVLLIRALVIVRELDMAPDAAQLIGSGLAVLRKLADLWPALKRHLTQWTSTTATLEVIQPPSIHLRDSSGSSISSPPWSPPLLLPSTSELSVPDLLHLSDIPLTQALDPTMATSAAAEQWFDAAEAGWGGAEHIASH